LAGPCRTSIARDRRFRSAISKATICSDCIVDRNICKAFCSIRKWVSYVPEGICHLSDTGVFRPSTSLPRATGDKATSGDLSGCRSTFVRAADHPPAL
jgi:hypothetical protein